VRVELPAPWTLKTEEKWRVTTRAELRIEIKNSPCAWSDWQDASSGTDFGRFPCRWQDRAAR
jgi:hypothetical protein